jgi:hypothetical protein
MIEEKEKPCKGIGKAFGFEGCKVNNFKRTHGLCDSCLYDFYTTDERGKVMFQKRKIEVKKTKDKAEKKVLKDNLETLSQLEAKAKKSFQHWIRLRDRGLPCVSCNNHNPADWAGGHYFSAGTYSGLMFDPRNVHAQCNTYCNRNLHGNLIEYRKGLVKRYGIEFVEKLESEADEKRNYKFTKAELIAKKLQYDLLIREMK